MSHDDFDFEPVRGLPAQLPAGEHLLWQGSPRWTSLAIHAYHVRKVAIYFAALALWRIGIGIADSHAVSAIATTCVILLVLGGVALGVLSLLAYLTSRATVYSITSRRILLRHGIAVPLTINVPFKVIAAAELKQYSDRSGDIAVKVTPDQRVGFLINWPHVRPGHFAHPQPSFRSLDDANAAAEILGQALAADAGVAPVRINGTDSADVPASALRSRVVAAA
jgi:hypothetical protein